MPTGVNLNKELIRLRLDVSSATRQPSIVTQEIIISDGDLVQFMVL